jgi:CTP synthase (UTP-ammonia lyase)
LGHAADDLGITVDGQWVSTERVAATPEAHLASILGECVIVAPGSPYRDMHGALRAIRYARENGLPLLGTCGGFQHVVLEFARSVLGIHDAMHAEYDPYASTLFITELSCSPAGKEMAVHLREGSLAASSYDAPLASERYYCNFGLNPACAAQLEAGGLHIVGRDENAEPRVLELPGHPFFIATLFVPQARSLPSAPHPLVVALLRAARDSRRRPRSIPTDHADNIECVVPT